MRRFIQRAMIMPSDSNSGSGGSSSGGSSGGDASQLDALIDGSITEVSSNVENVRAYAFYNATGLKSITLGKVTRLPNYVLFGCSEMVTLNAPMVTYIGNNGIQNCKSLAVADFPIVSILDRYALSGCTSLHTVNMPNLTEIDNNALDKSVIKKMDCILRKIRGSSAWQNCTQFVALIIRREDSICTLNNTSNFTGTPIASGTGYIYVPRALVDSYKTATNWTTYANQFRALEDYTVDGTITGELDESKI